jgi:hypothetical protein
VGIDDGLWSSPGRAAIIPELNVTMRKECYKKNHSVRRAVDTINRCTYNNLEDEKPSHQ